MKRGAFELDQLAYWILALVALVFLILAIYLMREKGVNIIDSILNLFRFGQ